MPGSVSDRSPGGGVEASSSRVEQRQVALARERGEHRLARRDALALDVGEEIRTVWIAVAELADVGREPLEQHVEVAGGPERAAEPAELGTEAVCPLPIDEPPGGPQVGPELPGRDAQLVEILDVDAEPRARVVGKEPPELLLERQPERLERRRALRRSPWARSRP